MLDETCWSVKFLILLIVTVISSVHRSESVWMIFRENYVLLFHLILTHRIYISKVSRLKLTLLCLGRKSEQGRLDKNDVPDQTMDQSFWGWCYFFKNVCDVNTGPIYIASQCIVRRISVKYAKAFDVKLFEEYVNI